MKPLYRIIAICLFIFVPFVTIQNIQGQVKFQNGNFTTSGNISKQNFSRQQVQASLFDKKYFVLISFDRIPGEKIKIELESAGIKLSAYIPNNTYLATVDDKFDFLLSLSFGISSIEILPPYFKIEKDLIQAPIIHADPSSAIAVSYYNIEKKNIEEILSAIGVTIIRTKFDKDGLIFIRTSKEKLNDIAALPFVISISKQTIKDFTLNYNNNATHGNDALSYSGAGGRSLSGKGVTVGIGDNGDVASHIDFTGRLINRNGAYFSYHGTHTAGTTAGGGIIDPKKRGMSPKALFVSQYFSDIIVNTPTYFGDNGLTLTNNSYYSSAAGCAGNNKYDELSNYIDAQTRSNDDILHVIAAGNDGGLTCSGFPASFATIKSGWQTAKDVLTVGAIDNATNGVASFSSRGPVLDGRLKPEIVAGGVAIISTIPFNNYGQNGGTSMAAPTVTGSLSLLTQRYKQLNSGVNPKAYLLKALICNSAEDMGNAGPDFTYGFGKLNTRRAVESLEASHYFINTVSNGAANQHTISIPAGVKQVKILLYWPDKEATVNAAATLVNDLDIVVNDPFAALHLPLILNSSAGGVNNVSTEGADHKNNIEQVVIDNPAAGNYTINISGYAVPFGPQAYAVTYEIITPSIFVEYPFGGETLVPGETETIRWNAYDGNANSFNVEYSNDNGSTWQTVNNNVPATQPSCAWTVPGTATNAGLIRVSRNSTAVTGVSSFNFSVLGQPDLTTSIPCDGYIQLDWPAISSATGYDVFVLTGDSMKVVASTTVNTYLLKGLDINKSYWVAVAAKNNSITGRRSIAKNVTPTSGICTLPDFDNDLKAVSILEPATGREFTSTASLATKPIKIAIKNLDNVSSTSTFNVSYSVNGATAVTETITPAIAAGATYLHTFTQHAILPGPFVHNIKVWVTKTADLQHANDTAGKVVKLLANPLSALPFNEGFETAAVAEYTTNTIGLEGLDDADFFTNTASGRARSFVNTGFAHSGLRAITLDQTPKNVTTTADSLLVTHNLSNYSISSDQLRLDFFYKNNGQDNLPGNKVWIRGSDLDAWLPAYDLYSNQAGIGQYKAAKAININDVFSASIPQQNVTGSFQIKFGEEGYMSSNSPVPGPDTDDGYTFDDIKISKALNDVAVMQVVSPFQSGCGLTATTPITIKIRNYNNATFNNIQVSYKINNGAIINQTIAVLNPNELLTFTFAATADLSAYIDYNVDVWLNYPPDTYNNNDSILNFTFHNSPLISSYPYLERFESSDGNWFTKGTNSSWQWGTPAGNAINKAANGGKAWVTSGDYNNNELSYLYSPCFDLGGLSQPVLSFSHIFELEDNCDCDYHWVEYSNDGGITWIKLGANGSGTNWYDNATNQRWQLSKTKWHVASIDVPTNSSAVRFRFVLSSDGGVTYEGVGIDDIHVFDKAAIYTGPDITLAPQNVSGTGWVNFNAGGNRVVSINPYGQNLGSTTVSAYFNTASVRVSNNQYYLDRNIVITPSLQPAQYVGIRYYFTEAEARLLINASGCGTCTTIKDAYESGVTKYSGAPAEENGTLADDSTGFFQFFTPDNVDVVPYNNGYYAEFSTNSFSEFWINKAGAGNIFPFPITLLSFSAIKNSQQSKLTWSTSQEINSDKFLIERSGNGIDFISIGEVIANGNTNVESIYHFTDAQPLKGLNYYRLKMIDRSGKSNRSLVRKLNFDINSLENSIYPNPVSDGKLFIKTSEDCDKIELFDMVGHKLKTFIAKGLSNQINIGKLPAGVYQLKIFTGKNVRVEKVNVQ